MGYHDFCKPKIGCFCANIGCFADFLIVQAKFDLHNTIIKHTNKKSRRKRAAERYANDPAAQESQNQCEGAMDAADELTVFRRFFFRKRKECAVLEMKVYENG